MLMLSSVKDSFNVFKVLPAYLVSDGDLVDSISFKRLELYNATF